MIDIENRLYQPSMEELRAYTDCEAFDSLYSDLEREYQPMCKIEYSCDKAFLGWNAKYKKAGRTLCTVYPRRGHFPLLVVVGQREKQRVEALMPSFSAAFQEKYVQTQEGMGQRWLMFDLSSCNELYDDILRVVRIRRESR